jgi:hypothetical protein
MNDSVIIKHDGERYLVLCSNTEIWGEGRTLDEAFNSYTNKTHVKSLIVTKKTLSEKIRWTWLKYRKKTLCFLVIVAIVYAQAAVFIAIPISVRENLPEVINALTKNINSISDKEIKQINVSLINLDSALNRFSRVYERDTLFLNYDSLKNKFKR